MDRYQIASIRLVFPSPLFPEMQLTFGEKEISWKDMFRKSWTTIFSSTGIAEWSYYAKIIILHD